MDDFTVGKRVYYKTNWTYCGTIVKVKGEGVVRVRWDGGAPYLDGDRCAEHDITELETWSNAEAVA